MVLCEENNFISKCLLLLMNATFETFNQYPWDSDQVFQAGLQTILAQLPQDNDLDANLMKAKHFYFSR